MLILWLVLGLFFGIVAGTQAFLITYREYAQHKMERHRLLHHSLSSALFAGAFFFLSTLAVGFGVTYVLAHDH
ncbi:MAG: hypothetical protein KGO02_21155 [Alphaproteobacteria bacterium]|nr:hypothetical protein [Alphaproteobacteria bacterium]